MVIHCTGPCDQGRKLCPTPHACGIAQVPDEDAPQQDIVRVVIGDVAIAVAIVALIAFIVWGVL